MIRVSESVFGLRLKALSLERHLLPSGSGRITLQNTLHKEPMSQDKSRSRYRIDDRPTFVDVSIDALSLEEYCEMAFCGARDVSE